MLLFKALKLNKNMNNKIKNYLGSVSILVLLVVTYSVYSYVDSYSKSIQPSSFRSFSVNGEGKIVAVPDVAQFSFGLTTQGGKDIATLQKDNTNKMNKIITFIKSKGVDKKDIETANYSLEPRYQNFNCVEFRTCPPSEIVGYTMNQNVSVKVRDFNKVGEILSGVVQNGANTVSQLSFTIDDRSKVENEAREKAITQAKQKALSIARAGDFRLGRLLSINEGGGIVPPYYGYGGVMEMKASSLPEPMIEPGSQDIIITVNLVYEIQ